MREVGERGEVGKGRLVEFWWRIRVLYTWGKRPAPQFLRLTWDLMCHGMLPVHTSDGNYGVYLSL